MIVVFFGQNVSDFFLDKTISLFSGEKLYLDFELFLHASNENYFKSVTHCGSIFLKNQNTLFIYELKLRLRCNF